MGVVVNPMQLMDTRQPGVTLTPTNFKVAVGLDALSTTAFASR
jgi:hypothetical protein